MCQNNRVGNCRQSSIRFKVQVGRSEENGTEFRAGDEIEMPYFTE
jgi:hypothetical protein